MLNKQSLIEKLYQKWVNKQASPEEVDELFDLLSTMDVDNQLSPLMKSRWEQGAEGHSFGEERQLAIVRQILEKYPPDEEKITPPVSRIHLLKTAWFRYAAAVLLILGAGAYFIDADKTKETKTEKPKNTITRDIAPGGNKAMLTLADGSTIILDNASNGQLVQQGGATVVKSANGEIIYTADKISPSASPIYNTMSTPRGGQYRLTLPDGSTVWLNASSSITFPTVFTGKERGVSITGEVYFEVAKNKTHPFLVRINNDIQVEVLGTHFNINAYNDEASVNATLIEGAIRIKNDKGMNVLNPGQQAQVDLDGNTTLKKDVDLQSVIAWKNDEFYFGERADFGSVMRQIARWYDIDVAYKGTVTGHLGGSISRKASISMVLQLLEKAGGVQFEVEGKKVTVIP